MIQKTIKCPKCGELIRISTEKELISEKKAFNELMIPIDQAIDLVVLAVKKIATRCKILTTGEPITFRIARFDVPGEILTVRPSKVWRYGKTHYISGKVECKRIDVLALDLKPLSLKDEEVWNPEDEYWGEPDDPIEPCLKPIIEFGHRQSYEMEQIIPGEDIEDPDSDPILEASDYHQCGAYDKAFKIMENILTSDLRCLDAHAHLGNWKFNSTNKHYPHVIEEAKKHYEVGVRIGELSLPKDFNGLLPWNRINNRPFLRCLIGYGLSLWRLGNSRHAREVFQRMLWLNPVDNQGVRFLLASIDDGKTWYDRDESRAF